jgi:translation initiation factor 1
MNGKKKDQGGFVYSTNPDFVPESNGNDQELPAKGEIQLRVFLDRLGGNRMVSRVEGFPENFPDLDQITKVLKQKCGVGGSLKGGTILIQGDHREKIVQLLTKDGFKVKKAGG